MWNRKLIITLSVLLGVVLLVFLCGLIVKRIYPLKYENYIKQYSREYNLDPYLVAALIEAESNFENNASSHKSAKGLMQITGDTGVWIASKMSIQDYSEEMLYNPEYNIKMGCWYLNNLREEFGDNVDLILAAYNAGRGNVKSWLQSGNYSKDGKRLSYIPFKETDQYVKKIETNYNVYRFIYKKRLE
ncbi:MAG: lytic transglycosylase domain-containing protein [Bacillota bacterium]|nr:lytic transglycosylase domain-containing protein [Bacillota bacterium]